MNTEIVTEVAHATLDGSIPFFEVARRLIETGAEYYHVDYRIFAARGEVIGAS